MTPQKRESDRASLRRLLRFERLQPPFVRALRPFLQPFYMAMRRLLLVFFGGIGLILLAGIVMALRLPKPITSGPLSLPDGSVARIMAVTYGTNHVVGRPLGRSE